MENLFLSNLYKDTRDASRDEAALNQQHIDDGRSYRCRAVRTHRYKLIRYYEQSPVYEELYDLKEDPTEQHNLIQSEEHQHVAEELRSRIECMTEQILAGHVPQSYFPTALD